MEEERAITTAVSLYPRHRNVITSFAERTGRSVSNAAQRIVDQWAEEHPDQWNGQQVEAEPQEQPA